MSEEIVHFVVTGEFITEKARGFWAEEDLQEKAVDILKCMHGITDAQVMDILEGRAKLTGDSHVGIKLEPDDAKMPGLKEVIKKLKRERDEALDERDDLIQLATGETDIIGSPGGARRVPRRKTARNNRTGGRCLKDGYEWEDLPDMVKKPKNKPLKVYQDVPGLSGAKMPEDGAVVATHKGKKRLQPPQPRIPPAAATPPPPVPWKDTFDTKLTGRNGWLSPEGKFYGCSYGQHNWLADKLGFDGWDLKDEHGWLKMQSVCDDEQHFFYNYEKYPIGSPVHEIWRKLIVEFCAERNIKIPFHFSKEAE